MYDVPQCSSQPLRKVSFVMITHMKLHLQNLTNDFNEAMTFNEMKGSRLNWLERAIEKGKAI
jgi:hypothetical protein